MISCQIKELAEARGIKTAAELSQRSGVPYTACLKLWNKKQTMMSFKVLDRFCRSLRTTPGKIFVYQSEGNGNGKRKKTAR